MTEKHLPNKTATPIYLSDMGIVCALGKGKNAVSQHLFEGKSIGITQESGWLPDRDIYVAKVIDSLVDIPERLLSLNCRNNQLLATVAEETKSEITDLLKTVSPHKVATIVGSSTSGILEGEFALDHFKKTGSMPSEYHYVQQELGSPAVFLKQYLNLKGPAYTVSTACSSSAKAFSAAQRLIDSGVVDAAIVAGSDSLCRLTTNGFSALESVSKGLCDPMGINRDGITIGEGAALFILRKDKGQIELLGVGESSDGHHISAPHPEGEGAEAAMVSALKQSNLSPSDISYLNLHGTATQKNDDMESKAVHRLLGESVPCSSTKALIGHCLGAAGALEVGFLWLTLSNFNQEKKLPPHVYSGDRDLKLDPICLTDTTSHFSTTPFSYTSMMSNSFAFGGSNASVIIGKKYDKQ